MAMPSGDFDTPAKTQDYYNYLQSHDQTFYVPATWHVHWLDLAWMWGFLIVLGLLIVWWIRQYRTTRQKANLYPVDSFGGYTSELAGPATFFFLLLTVIVTGWAIVMIVGHIVWGQKF